MQDKTKVTIKDVYSFWEKHAPGFNELKHIYVEDKKLFFDELDLMISARSPKIQKNYRMDLVDGLEVLDIGCGQGYNAEQLVRNGAKLTAIDLTDMAIKLTKERFQARGLNANILNANAERLPFNDSTFDYIHSSGVLHHTPKINKAIKEIYRVMREGGLGSIMIYHKSSWTYWYRIQVRLRIIMIILYLMPGSLRNIILSKKPSLTHYISSKWPTSEDALRTGTDFGGINNPLSRIYTKSSALKLFSLFKVEGFAVSQSAYKPFKKNKNILEIFLTYIFDKLGEKWGWYLFVYFKKEKSNN